MKIRTILSISLLLVAVNVQSLPRVFTEDVIYVNVLEISESHNISPYIFEGCSARARMGADAVSFRFQFSKKEQLRIFMIHINTEEWRSVHISEIGILRDIIINAYNFPPLLSPNVYGDRIFEKCVRMMKTLEHLPNRYK